MKQDQTAIIEKAGIEIVGGEYGCTTINEELGTRNNTARKICRALYTSPDEGWESFDKKTLLKMEEENNLYRQKLLDLKKELSPFKEVIPHYAIEFELGAILTDSWGWEQTNIDFYCIVKRSGNWLTVLPMTKQSGELTGALTQDEMPGEIDFTKDPIRKKLQLSSDGKEYGFSFGNGMGYCKLWDGEKEQSTHYA